MSQQVETSCRTFQASGALGAYTRVKLDGSNQLELCGATDVGVGVLQTAALAANDYRDVKVWNSQGTMKMVAAGAITQEAVVYGAANGRVDDTATGLALGIALEAAGAAGDVIEVLPVAIIEQVTGVFSSVTAPALVMTGTTGNQTITLTTNLADSLSIVDGAGDLIVFDTTTGTQVITIVPALTVTGAFTASSTTALADNVSITDAKNVAVGTTTGTIIGTAANQKLGFFGTTAVVQQTAIANANNNVDNLMAQLNSVIVALETLGLLAT